MFPRPDQFEPERFAEPRAEDRAKPFSFTSFGGGRHGSMGTTFAYLQVGTMCWLMQPLCGGAADAEQMPGIMRSHLQRLTKKSWSVQGA